MTATAAASLPSAPLAARAVLRALATLRRGRLVLTTPDGLRRVFEGDEPGPVADLRVADWRVFGRIARRSEIGLFEAWRDRLVHTRDMTAVLRLAAANASALEGLLRGSAWLGLLPRLAHALRANTRAGARRNIHRHYDLGNDFYALWLDPGMTYSAALFDHAGQSLLDAQRAKYDRVVAALALRPGQRVLEIGCGWGAFAEHAATEAGCHVTGITISRAQLAFAQERIARAGLAPWVDLRFLDYRDTSGTFDRIVSLEMLEAVGERFWPAYFGTLARRLAPGGRALVQSIVIDEAAFEHYRRSSDFIREYIFPGGMLPTVERMRQEALRTGLRMGEPFRFGRDYAETLRRWRTAFDEAEPRVRALGFDDAFLAAWRFYLHYCEAGFEEGRIDVVQVELAHA